MFSMEKELLSSKMIKDKSNGFQITIISLKNQFGRYVWFVKNY